MKHNDPMVGKRLGNLNDLPQELLSQLQVKGPDESEKQILWVIKQIYGGVATTDEILVGLYREFNLILKRQYLSNKLYRMGKAELLWSIKGKKGVYSIEQDVFS